MIKNIAIIFFITEIVFINLIFSAENEKKLKSLIIYGKNFWFIITEPKGWTVEIEDANARQLNAYFVMDGYTWDNSPGLIYIRVMDKQGLTVEEHLKADMKDYKNKNQSIQFKKYNVKGFRYHYASKNYLIGNKYCDYLCYADPGPDCKSYLIFVLTSNMKECGRFTDVFNTFLKSFTWGGDKVEDGK